MSQPQMYPNAPRPPTTADQCVSKVELRIECRNLLDKDVMSKSDPCAVLYMSRRGGHWDEIGRTENIKNCLDPKFSRCFKVNYYFEEVQKCRIAVYDLDNATPELSDDDFLGQLDCTLGQLVSSNPFTKNLLMPDGRTKAGNGVITVRAEEVKEGGEIAYMTFRGKNLDKKDFFGKSDPYLEILRSTMDRSWQVVHRTEVIKNSLNPSWRPFQVPLSTLCAGNRSQEIRLISMTGTATGVTTTSAGFTTTVDEMMKASHQEYSWPVINPKKKSKKKNYTNSGICLLTSMKIMKEHTFLEFIFGGMQINFTVGVDFTASNGNPGNPTSLHYINPYQPNEYMQAIRAVGDVCQDYDSDKMFPALGFGAKIPPAMEVSHEFAVNFDMQNPFCQGIDGVLGAYSNCIRHVQLYGPTNVSPIIRHVARFAYAAQREEQTKGAHAYYILLLLTDGVLSDMSSTKQAIVEASKLPMSLIIVGVGGADFSMMEELDGDDGLLRAPSGEPVKRDIVQFVPFREFKQSSKVELARHVLFEVPQQVTQYYKMRGIRPSPPVERPAVVPADTEPSNKPSATPSTHRESALPPNQSMPATYPQGAPYNQGPPSQPGPPYQQGQYPSQGPPPQQGQYPSQGPPTQQGPPYQQGPYPSQGPPSQQGGLPYPQAGYQQGQSYQGQYYQGQQYQQGQNYQNYQQGQPFPRGPQPQAQSYQQGPPYPQRAPGQHPSRPPPPGYQSTV
ncbi:LOW QUALITY PROTEIN: copine-3-like [Haliotis rubra]|uniref:LOW QUALITY PROTEIN: copine-3-like n=1 Tax=Haliotis rubra TaxID=36100 RepID=UPI001EE55491|nr:LOW QUALITY PROTEIN: copine-3-like [Haliotis rubra]